MTTLIETTVHRVCVDSEFRYVAKRSKENMLMLAVAYYRPPKVYRNKNKGCQNPKVNVTQKRKEARNPRLCPHLPPACSGPGDRGSPDLGTSIYKKYVK